jgi:predicted O-methyltransferase YrrM
MKRLLKRFAKRALLRIHEIGLRLNLVILPKHYYVPIPDLHELRRNRARWARRSPMLGIETDPEGQLRRLRALVKPFQAEYLANDAHRRATQGDFGPGFGPVEAQALHGMIRALKPKRVVEIGSGVSTYCMLAALERNAAEGAAGRMICIEPHPRPWLRAAPVEFIEAPLQDADLALFESLAAGDLLFVDSSHTVRVDGDVNLIVLEVLPRLASGVVVHFHDITFPYDFQRDADRTVFQWMETAMLHAFLIGNRRFEILFCLSQLHYDRPEGLRELFPEYRPQPGESGLRAVIGGRRDDFADDSREDHFPSSLYLRVTDAS